jgi:hypothetical protein
MLCLKTGRLRLSRDVQWLGKCYGEYHGLSSREDDTPTLGNGKESPSDISNVTSERVEENPDIKVPTISDPSEGWHTVTTGREAIVYEATPTGQTRSGTTYKSDIVAVANTYSALYESDEDPDENNDIDLNDSDTSDPETFEEAWNQKSAKERKGWREAIRKEFDDMNTTTVWKKTKRMNVPKHKRLIGCKWEF